MTEIAKTKTAKSQKKRSLTAFQEKKRSNHDFVSQFITDEKDLINLNKIYPVKELSPYKNFPSKVSSWGYLIKSMQSGYFGAPTKSAFMYRAPTPVLGHAHPWIPNTSSLYKSPLTTSTVENLMGKWFSFLDENYKNDGILSKDASKIDELWRNYQINQDNLEKENEKNKRIQQLAEEMGTNENIIQMFGEYIFPIQNNKWSYLEAEGATHFFVQMLSKHFGESHKTIRISMSHLANDLSDCYFSKISTAPQGFILAFRAILNAFNKNPNADLHQCQYPMKLKISHSTV